MNLPLDLIGKLIVQIFVMSTMLGVGLALMPREILAPLRDRTYMGKALLANFLLLPGIAWLITRSMNLDPAMSTAVLVLATVPGGPALVKLAAAARADLALAVTLVVLLMLGSLLYQPLVLPMLVEGLSVSPIGIARTLLISVLLPLGVGLLLRVHGSALAARLLGPIQRVSNFSMLALLVLMPAIHFAELRSMVGGTSLAAALLYLGAAIVIGGLVGGSSVSGRRTLALCCGQGNFAAAFVVAIQNLHDPRVVVMLLLLMLVSVTLLVPLAIGFGRRSLQLA